MKKFTLACFALCVLSCSSEPRVVTSGGAIIFLRFAQSGGTCPDLSLSPLTVATKDVETGSPKLTLDGAEGAVVRCRFDENRFDLSIAQNNITVIANGNFSKTSSKATEVSFTLGLPSGATYRSSTTKCTMEAVRHENGSFYGTFECPRLDHASLSGSACGVNFGSIGPNTFGSFMQFANCEGF